MKALLCSNFRNMGKFFLPSLDIDDKNGVTILFVTYALDNEEYMNQNKTMLLNNLNVKKIIELKPEYDFEDKIDLIFVIGGITDNLIEALFKHKQIEKIKKLIFEENVIYISESAGSDFAGNYTNYDLYENFPRNYDLIKTYGKSVFDGLRLINKMIVTHASKYRVRVLNNNEYCRVPYSEKYVKDYEKTIEKLDKNNINYETIANNEALLVMDNTYKKLSYDWSTFPIVELELTENEKKLKAKVNQNNI